MGDFFGTGIEIWAGFGPVGITEKTSPKGFSASKCDVGNWIFSIFDFFEKLFGNSLDFFGIFGGSF